MRVATIALAFFIAIAGYATPLPFSPGEKLYYRAHWQNITGGHALVEVVKQKKIGKRQVFMLRMLARSSNFVDTFFKVRDRIETHWDFSRRTPLRVYKNLNEGFNKRIYKMEFTPGARKATFWQRAFMGNSRAFGIRKKTARWRIKKGGRINLAKDIQDYLGSLYYMRSDPRRGKPGMRFHLNIFDDRHFKKIKVHILKREKLTITAGTFRALKVTTDFRTKGLLKSKGSIYAWVSDDKDRFPLLLTAQIPVFGSVNLELVKIVRGRASKQH